MLTGFTLALANYVISQKGGLPEGQMSMFPAFMASHAIHVICWISLFAALASIIATLLTPPVDEALIQRFVQKVRPLGFWKGHNEGYPSERTLGASVVYWLLGTGSIYAGMFGVGYLLRLQYVTGGVLLVICLVSLVIMVRGMGRIDQARAQRGSSG